MRCEMSKGTTDWRDSIAVTGACNNWQLWHFRLGHMSLKGLKNLCSKEKYWVLKQLKLDCVKFVFSKNRSVLVFRGGQSFEET